jgi:hypothetical protein
VSVDLRREFSTDGGERSPSLVRVIPESASLFQSSFERVNISLAGTSSEPVGENVAYTHCFLQGGRSWAN